MNESTIRRIRFSLGAVALAAATVSFVSYFHIEHNRWEPPYLLGAGTPPGIDFRGGLYRPAQALLLGVELAVPYPPFTTLLATPFLLLDIDSAYYVQVGLLYVLNIACLWLGVRTAGRVFANGDDSSPEIGEQIAFPLFLVVAFLVVSSYGFFFSLERGNWDIYSQFAALSGLWLMLNRPRWIWAQVACFSIAAHLKVYPAILFLLIVWQHRWKSLLPLIAINTALLLSTGFSNALRFFNLLAGFATYPYLWQGNHSAASFARMVNNYLGPRGIGSIPPLVFYILPAGLWLFACMYLLRRRYSSIGGVWLFILSVPMMNLIPIVSHDYKLVLLGAPIAMALFFLARDYATSGRAVRVLQIVAVAALGAVLGLSYTRLPVVLGNKYPFILALQAVLLWALVTPSAAKRPDTRDVVAPSKAPQPLGETGT